MKYLVFLLSMFCSIAFGGPNDRVIQNFKQDGDILFRVNDGGTFKTVMTAVGADGLVQFLGVKGATDGVAACTGCIGQEIACSGSPSGINTALVEICNIALTAGDWTITASAYCAGSTVASSIDAFIADNTAGFTGTTNGVSRLTFPYASVSGAGSVAFPGYRLLLSSSTTKYFNVSLPFNSPSATCNGSLRARRVR